MTTMKRLLVLAGLALVAVGASASIATAASGIMIRPGRISHHVSLGEITFTAGASTVTCRLTLGDEFTELLVAIEHQIGQTEALFQNCVSPTLIQAILNKPWPITLTKINDLAPSSVPAERATSTIISITGFALDFSRLGIFINCLFGSATSVLTLRGPVTRTGAAKEYTWGLLTIRETNRPTEARFAFTRGEGTCPAEITLRGIFEHPTNGAQTLTLL
jgi:hypothetical protein